MGSIINEAKRNAALATDIDNFRGRYVDIEYDYKGDIELNVYFPAFSIYAYDKNFFVLLATSTKEPFQPRWQQRPDYTSFDMYNSVIYWPLLLYVNRINSIEDFKNIEYVLVPPFKLIFDLSKDRIPVSDVKNIYEEEISSYSLNYFKLHPTEQEQITNVSKNNISTVTSNIRTTSSITNMVKEERWIVTGGSY